MFYNRKNWKNVYLICELYSKVGGVKEFKFRAAWSGIGVGVNKFT